MIRRLFTLLLRRYPQEVAAITGLSLLAAAFEGVGISVVLPILDSLDSPAALSADHPISRLLSTVLAWVGLPFAAWTLLLLGAGMVLCQAVAKYARVNLTVRTSTEMEARLRLDLFRSLAGAHIGYIHQRQSGALANALITEADRARGAFVHAMNGVGEIALVLVYVGMAFAMSWQLSLAAFALLPMVALFSRVRQHIYKKGTELTRANDRLHSGIFEYLVGVRDLKIFGLQSHACDDVSSRAKAVGRETWLLNRIIARIGAAYEVVMALVLVLLIVVAFGVLGEAPSVIITVVAVLFRLSPRVNLLQKNYDDFLGVLPGFERCVQIIDETTSCRSDTDSTGTKLDHLRSAIVFQDVSFSYGPGQDRVLDHIDLELPRGSTIGIVGVSGAGKSTFVDLIARFHEPSEGRILVDDVDLNDLDLGAWRRMIGFVSQDTFLFNAGVGQNIAFGDLNASEGEIREAAVRANAHSFIEQLPDGYETVVGDRGVRLSGGERQRLSLARALLRKPQILILDEATSDLDSRSERLIQESLDEMAHDCTIIVVAHRLSTLARADSIIVLDGGAVVETGTHDSLLRDGREYASLYHLQHGFQAHDRPAVAALE